MYNRDSIIRLRHRDNEVFVQKGEGPEWGHSWSVSANITVGAFLGTGCELSDDPETQRIWSWLSQRMSDYKLMLYSVEWQALRVRMKGDWATLDGAKANGRLIMEYIEKGNTHNISRVWRCLNLLNAVHMGFNGAADLVGSPQDQIVVKLQALCSSRFETLKRHKHICETPSPDVIRAQWLALDNDTQELILKDLLMRTEQGNKETRPELWWFLEQIQSIEEGTAHACDSERAGDTAAIA